MNDKMKNEFVLQTNRVSKTYGRQKVLDQISANIKKGEIYGLVGENGAGKTTLIRLITGLAKPSEGDIMLFGKTSQKEIRQMRSRMGCIIERPTVYKDLTASQNLELMCLQRKLELDSAVYLKEVGLDDVDPHKKAKDFSLGMQQRLALAIALLGEPDFLILDEPINGLDPIGIQEIRQLLKKINEEKGMTILISSHILSELHLLATQYGFMHKGCLVEEISAEKLENKFKKHLEVVVPDSKQAAAAIKTTFGDVLVKAKDSQTLYVYGCLEEPEKIIECLAKSSIAVKQIFLSGENLESYFTHLVTDKEIIK